MRVSIFFIKRPHLLRDHFKRALNFETCHSEEEKAYLLMKDIYTIKWWPKGLICLSFNWNVWARPLKRPTAEWGGAWGDSAKKCQNWCTLHNINQVCEGFDHHFLMNVLFVVDSVEMCNCNIAQLFRQPVCTILLLPPTFLKMKMGNNELTWTLVFPSWEMSFTNSMLGNACKTFSNAKEAYGLFINEQPPYSAIAPTLNRFYRDDLESSGYVTEAYNLCTVVNWPRRTPCAIALYSRTVIYCKQKTEHFSKFHMHDFSIHKQASTVRCVSW